MQLKPRFIATVEEWSKYCGDLTRELCKEDSYATAVHFGKPEIFPCTVVVDFKREDPNNHQNQFTFRHSILNEVQESGDLRPIFNIIISNQRESNAVVELAKKHKLKLNAQEGYMYPHIVCVDFTDYDPAVKEMLTKIFEKQRGIMDRFYDINNMTLEDKMRETHRFLTAIQCEVVEILHEKGGIEKIWKNWKKSGSDPDIPYIHRECIDILHFLVEILIIWGADAKKTFEVYMDKNKENHARYDGKY